MTSQFYQGARIGDRKPPIRVTERRHAQDRPQAKCYAIAMAHRNKSWARRWLRANGYWS